MGKVLQFILDWSEIWALLIPLIVLLFQRKQPVSLKPVIIYLWLALLINVVIDVIMAFKNYFPGWLQSNNPFYNVHSVIRFICFSIFFIQLPQASFFNLKKLLPILSVVFIIINFGFSENFLTVLRKHLLMYCYYYPMQ